ncbi:MAG: type II toxin-antitoxin system VapC family toxin [Anaerolineales bacterium]
MIVVDANLIGHLFIEGEFTALAIQVFEKDPDWYAPMLWQSEMRSIVTKHFRFQGMAFENAQIVMTEAHHLMFEHEQTVSSHLVIELVASSKCTSYDCEYVALAREMKLPLVTFDKDILRDFPQIAISPQSFITA